MTRPEDELTPGEKRVYRAYLTAITLCVSFFFFPLVVVLKIAEAAFVSIRIVADSMRQIWAKPRDE